MRALLFKTTHEVEYIEVDGTLKSLQDAVGGMIEFLPLTDNAHAYIDEEGKLKGKEINLMATMLCQRLKIGLMPNDMIVGNMIVLGSLNENGEEDGESHDAPSSLLPSFSKVIGQIIEAS